MVLDVGERCARERHLIAKRFERHKDAGNKSNVLQTRDAADVSIVSSISSRLRQQPTQARETLSSGDGKDRTWPAYESRSRKGKACHY